ncbi:hypothetical protein Tco_0063199, partial [Tanacetum coccineum]
MAHLFLSSLPSYKELSEIARMALVDENWLRLWSFGASALYSFDSRVRVCSLLTVVIQEPEQGTTTTTPTTIISVPKPPHDKGRGIMIEEPVVEQIEEEEERLAREKAQQIEEANIAWDDVQAKIEIDYKLAQRLQAQEQEELTDEEKARLFIQFLEQRRKHFAAKRAEEKRNRPLTRAQQRSIIIVDKAMKRVNTYVDYRTELVEESSKKAEIKLEENLKK